MSIGRILAAFRTRKNKDKDMRKLHQQWPGLNLWKSLEPLRTFVPRPLSCMERSTGCAQFCRLQLPWNGLLTFAMRLGSANDSHSRGQSCSNLWNSYLGCTKWSGVSVRGFLGHRGMDLAWGFRNHRQLDSIMQPSSHLTSCRKRQYRFAHGRGLSILKYGGPRL